MLGVITTTYVVVVFVPAAGLGGKTMAHTSQMSHREKPARSAGNRTLRARRAVGSMAVGKGIRTVEVNIEETVTTETTVVVAEEVLVEIRVVPVAAVTVEVSVTVVVDASAVMVWTVVV